MLSLPAFSYNTPAHFPEQLSCLHMNTIVDKGSKLLTINQNRTIGVDIHLKKAINTMLSRKKMVKH